MATIYEVLSIRNKCSVCGKAFKISENVGSLDCSIKVTMPGKPAFEFRSCHILQKSSMFGAPLSWSDCINKLGTWTFITKQGIINLTKPIDEKALADPKEHNEFLRSIINLETHRDLYERMKIPEDESHNFTDLFYYYNFDWKLALPEIIYYQNKDMRESMQPFNRSSYFCTNFDNHSKHIYDTNRWERMSQKEREIVIRALRSYH